MIRALPLALAATLALPAVAPSAAAQTLSPGAAQLAASVQYGLDTLGYREVDARRLSTGQLVELTFILDGAPPLFGLPGLRVRNEVEAVLRREPWGPGTDRRTNVNQ